MKPLIATPTAYVGRDGKVVNKAGQYVQACAYEDPDLMSAEHPADVEEAKAVCGRCWFKDACLERALATREPAGVWGGMSVEERGEVLATADKARRKVRDDARAARKKAEREAAERAVQPELDLAS